MQLANDDTLVQKKKKKQQQHINAIVCLIYKWNLAKKPNSMFHSVALHTIGKFNRERVLLLLFPHFIIYF